MRAVLSSTLLQTCVFPGPLDASQSTLEGLEVSSNGVEVQTPNSRTTFSIVFLIKRLP